MQKLKIRSFLINLSLLSVVFSCTPEMVKEFTPLDGHKTSFTSPYFSDPSADYIYKANVTVYNKAFGGIFIAKKVNDSTHRVVFTTEFGNKLFDLELTEQNFKVNFIMDELNRKIIINTLKRDFMLLLRDDFKVDKQFENAGFLVYRSQDRSRYNYIFEDKTKKLPLKVIQTKGRKEKIIMDFNPLNKTTAEKIVIAHQNIPLKIELHLMNN